MIYLNTQKRIQILISTIICVAHAYLVRRLGYPSRMFADKHSMMIDAYTTSYVPINSRSKSIAREGKNSSIYFERVQIGDESLSSVNKPVMLFLPGLDGRGDYSSNVNYSIIYYITFSTSQLPFTDN